jgi:tRNA/rRNA methyltransferase
MRANLQNLKVVLVRTRNPLNIGAAARAMSNFGVEHLRVVNPYDVAFREARSAVGAAELLKKANDCASVEEATADCSLVVGTTSGANRDIRHPVRRLEDGAAIIREQLQAGGVALLFGSEKVGLSTRDLSHCHWVMRIPTREEHSSMNLAQAVAVCLYEVVRSTPQGQIPPNKTHASAAKLQRLTDELTQALLASGYMTRSSPAAEEKMRRLVLRLALAADDADLLLGMLRQINWKLQQNRP